MTDPKSIAHPDNVARLGGKARAEAATASGV
jgi:hypothetical protein